MFSLPFFLLVPAYLAAASPINPQGQAPEARNPNVAVIPLTNPVYHRFNTRAGKTKTFDAAAAKKEINAVIKKHGKQQRKRDAAQKQKENDAKKDAAEQKSKDDMRNAQKGKDDKKSNNAQKGKDDTKTGTTQKGKDNQSAQKGKQDDKSGATKGKDNTKSNDAQKGKDDTKSGNTQKGKDDSKSNAAQKGKDDTKNDAVRKGKGARAALEPSEPFDIKDLRKRGYFEKRQNLTGIDPLTNYRAMDFAYYGSVSVGTPGQNTTVLFDTGSSDLILPLSTCSSCGGPLFTSNLSTTFHDTLFYFDIEYLDGSGSRGTVAYDAVSVAGLNVKNQSFGAIQVQTNDQGLPSAGIMGMGFPANAQTRSLPFLFNLAQDGSLASNVFSFFLSRDEITGSELCLGCIDSTKFNGTIDWHPLETNATNGTSLWWNIASDGISVNGTKPSGRFEAIIDSGTSLIYVPPTVAAELYRSIPDSTEDRAELGPGFYTFPCNNSLSLPPVSFVFNGTEYAVNPSDFNVGAGDIFGTRCVGGIVGLDIGLRVPAAIIGVEFMKAWYSVFDLDNARVGFAPTFGP